jgi:CheY-like chemotaxis protein
MSTPRSILVVDDTDEVRETLVEALSFEGFTVSSAQNGREAIDWIRRHPETECLILLDLAMPIMDGRAFLDARARDPLLSRVPVIVMTAADDYATIGASQNVAVSLSKTAPLDVIYAAIRSVA